MDIKAVRRSIEAHIAFSFSRSGGPGGQNVNKVNTKVFAEVLFAAVEGLSPEEREQARKRLAPRINRDGCLFAAVQDERSQERNREIALNRLESLVAAAAVLPKKRTKTKPTRASRERRLNSKKLHGKIKALRRLRPE